MTRTVKFRAWDKEKKEMLHFGEVWFCDEYNSVCFEVEEVKRKEYFGALKMENQDKVELMQFTGLKDKNGREIYEGDIVKVTVDDLDREDEDEPQIEVVEWDKTGGYWSKLDLNDYYEPLGSENLFLEVIGNTYENPELLTNQ